MENATIFAIASGAGRAAIAVLRLSRRGGADNAPVRQLEAAAGVGPFRPVVS